MSQMTADEAHKPHESELLVYLHGIHSDAFQAISLMPDRIYKLLNDLRWIDGYSLTPLGLAQIGGK